MLFGWTTPALLAGAKTVSRQTWTPRAARPFVAGALVEAYDRDPRRRGRRLATLRLLGAPEYRPLAEMPESDYEAEGWRWLNEHPKALSGKGITAQDFSRDAFARWRARPYSVWVVRFEVVEVFVSPPREPDAAAPPAVEALTGAIRVPLELIDPHPEQPRRGNLPEIPLLAAHIAAHGLLQPIVVAPRDDGSGRYVLVAGSRRLAAVRHLHASEPEQAAGRSRWATIAAVTRTDRAGDRLLLALAENTARRDLSEADTLTALRLLRDVTGRRGADLARELGTSRAWISRFVVLDGDAELSELVQGGGLSVATAYEVYRARTPAAREAALAAARRGEARRVVRALAAGGTPPATPDAVADGLGLVARLGEFALPDRLEPAGRRGSQTMGLGELIRLLRTDLERAEALVRELARAQAAAAGDDDRQAP
jgi:ParB/RepB/Spo0J family partition protein